MGKVLLLTCMGFVILIIGIYAGYYYLTTLNYSPNPLLLALSLFFVGSGLFFLVLAGKGKSIIGVPEVENSDQTVSSDTLQLNQTLEKNKEIINQWKDMNTKKEKLKLLQLADEPVQQ